MRGGCTGGYGIRPYGVAGVGVPDDPWNVAAVGTLPGGMGACRPTSIVPVMRRAGCTHPAVGVCGGGNVHGRTHRCAPTDNRKKDSAIQPPLIRPSATFPRRGRQVYAPKSSAAFFIIWRMGRL